MSGLRIVISVTAALAVTLASQQAARADAHSEVTPTASGEAQRMTLPTGKILIQGYLDFNLSTDAVAKPISLAPDVWYGVNDDISVGLIHSGNGAGGFFGGVGRGLCFTGSDNGCGKFYNNLGINGRYHLFDGTDKPIVLAADGGLYFNSLDPFAMAIKLGAVGKTTVGPLDLLFGLNLFVGITERDLGNKEVLSLRITAMYPVNDKLSVGGQTGLVLPFDGAGDLFAIPIVVGARYMVSDVIAVDAAFSFPQLIGGDLTAGADGRVLTVGGSYLM